MIPRVTAVAWRRGTGAGRAGWDGKDRAGVGMFGKSGCGTGEGWGQWPDRTVCLTLSRRSAESRSDSEDAVADNIPQPVAESITGTPSTPGAG